MRLSEYARSRDNNFTLLRLIASLTVILYHSGPVLGIQGAAEFLFAAVGRSLLGDAEVESSALGLGSLSSVAGAASRLS